MAVPEPVQEETKQVFPQYRSLNITTRDVNVTARSFNVTTLVDKRAFIPEGKPYHPLAARHPTFHLGYYTVNRTNMFLTRHRSPQRHQGLSYHHVAILSHPGLELRPSTGSGSDHQAKKIRLRQVHAKGYEV